MAGPRELRYLAFAKLARAIYHRHGLAKDKAVVDQNYLEQLALALGAHPTAVWSWRYRGKVPRTWRLLLTRAAAQRRVVIPLELFDTFRPVREETPRVGRRSRAKGGPAS